jgi:hypothetical protein
MMDTCLGKPPAIDLKTTRFVLIGADETLLIANDLGPEPTSVPFSVLKSFIFDMVKLKFIDAFEQRSSENVMAALGMFMLYQTKGE